MRAIVNTGPNKLEMLELPTPVPGSGQVRIKTSACGICATDLEMVAGWERTPFPSTPGHEWSGVVDAVGEGVDETLLGKKCVAENVLADGLEVGFEHPGGYGEYLLNEVGNVHVLPDGYPMDVAALIEPLAVSVRAQHRLGHPVDGPALVIGDGSIGLLTCALLTRRGIDVTLVGGRPERLDVATGMGAVQTINYHELVGELAEDVVAATGCKFPTVIECSGSAKAVEACFGLVEKQGKVLILGDYAHAHANFRWNNMLWQEITLIGSNASAGAWEVATNLAVHNDIPLQNLITHRIKAEDFQTGYDAMHNRESKVIKIVMQW